MWAANLPVCPSDCFSSDICGVKNPFAPQISYGDRLGIPDRVGKDKNTTTLMLIAAP
jgi:hypothetical protein